MCSETKEKRRMDVGRQRQDALSPDRLLARDPSANRVTRARASYTKAALPPTLETGGHGLQVGSVEFFSPSR